MTHRIAVIPGDGIGREGVPEPAPRNEVETPRPAPVAQEQPPQEDQAEIRRYVSSIGGSTTLQGLKIIGDLIGDSQLSDKAKHDIKPIYAKKLHELEAEAKRDKQPGDAQ